MIQILLQFPRKIKQAIMLFFDIFAVILSLLAAFSIRLDQWFFPVGDVDLLFSIFLAPIFLLPIFFRFGLYNNVIRYLGLKEIWRIIQAVSLYVILWGIVIFMGAIEGVPRSVIVINWLLLLMAICGSRFFARWLLLEINNNNNVLIYGAGSSGRQLTRALTYSNDHKPIAFIDDESKLHGQSINGLKVYSKDDLKALIEKKKY